MKELWSDKYRPRKLSDFTYNKNTVAKLQKLACNSDIPHLCVEGIRGIGKKTMMMAFIRECVDAHGLCGEMVYKTENRIMNLKYNNKDINLTIQKSNYHFNLNPSNYGIYDRHIVQDSLRSIFRYRSITKFPYKNFIIRKSEELSLDAQQSLRRTLENCIKNCRFLFIVNTDKQGGLIPALKSRCISIRMSSPTTEEALQVIKSILIQEQITYLPDAFLKKFYLRCQGNLSRCLNLLQSAVIRHGEAGLTEKANSSAGLSLAEICPITKCCQEIIIELIEARNPKIYDIRQKFYMLLAHGVSSEEIIKRIFKIALDNLPGHEAKVAAITDQVEEQLGKSSREFYHLENYILQLLFLIKHHQSGTQKKTPKLSTSNKEPLSASVSSSLPKLASISASSALSKQSQVPCGTSFSLPDLKLVSSPDLKLVSSPDLKLVSSIPAPKSEPVPKPEPNQSLKSILSLTVKPDKDPPPKPTITLSSRPNPTPPKITLSPRKRTKIDLDLKTPPLPPQITLKPCQVRSLPGVTRIGSPPRQLVSIASVVTPVTPIKKPLSLSLKK